MSFGGRYLIAVAGCIFDPWLQLPGLKYRSSSKRLAGSIIFCSEDCVELL